MAWMPLMGFGIKQMKEEILQKSLTLFLKHGIKEMSNQTLVDWLGISTKTIYKYFQSKKDCWKKPCIYIIIQNMKSS